MFVDMLFILSWESFHIVIPTHVDAVLVDEYHIQSSYDSIIEKEKTHYTVGVFPNNMIQ